MGFFRYSFRFPLHEGCILLAYGASSYPGNEADYKEEFS